MSRIGDIDQITQEVDIPDGAVPMVCKVNREQFLWLLNEYFDGDEERIPDNAEVTVNIPGGGDYSNTDLTVERDIILTVRWRGQRR